MAKQSKSRAQHHYVYGSIGNGSETHTVLTGESNEQDSLVGEILVTTDNEEDAFHVSDDDGAPLFLSSKSQQRGPFPHDPRNFLKVLATLLVFGSVGFLFLSSTSSRSSQPIPQTKSSFVPFERVERADYGDPVEAFVDLDLFHSSLLNDNGPSTFTFPFPTGAFWTNLIVPSPDPKASYPVVVYPYAYKWSETSLLLSYPSNNRVEDKNHKWIIDAFAPELTLSTAETISKRHVTGFDPLSVSLEFLTTSGAWKTTLVQGSPYTTITYTNATPRFHALSIFTSVACPGDEVEKFDDFADTGNVDDNEESRRKLFGVCSTTETDKSINLRGVQFIFSTNEGERWILFSSDPINLTFDKIGKTIIESTAPFTGIIRIAYIPSGNSSDASVNSSTGLRRLIYHAGVYPTGANVSWKTRSSESAAQSFLDGNNSTATQRNGIVTFEFETESLTDTSLRPNAIMNGLLMLALPHHTQGLPPQVKLNSKKFDLSYRCIKGIMTPIIGSQWTYKEPLPNLKFDDHVHTVDAGVRDIILNQIEDDLTRVLPTNDENIYGLGKQVARLSQLVHIADRLEGTNRTEESSVTERGKELLFHYLEAILSSQVVDYLVFDNNMGGLVSKNGLADKSEDFGNGRYNDHHFHYGYLLYASAIMARLNSSFVDEYGSHVDAIFNEIVNSQHGSSTGADKSGGPFFPMTRHKSWFDGHSFATGMFPFGDGKSQESSSESVNCYYGAFLWSLATRNTDSGNAETVDFAHLLLAMEIQGAKTYWQMSPSAKNNTEGSRLASYSDKFEKNLMVGNVGMLDVACNTWFGNDPLYVEMINAIPITAATAALFDEEYVSELYSSIEDRTGEVEMAWRGYVVSMHAIIDPNAAWKEAQELVSYELDAALSKSQVLYFISQRTGFNVTATPDESHAEKLQKKQQASCSSYPACEKLGLDGLCCPSESGGFLGCCGSDKSSSSATSNSTSNDVGSCEMNPQCADSGLTGMCCPTAEGIHLGCCKTS